MPSLERHAGLTGRAVVCLLVAAATLIAAPPSVTNVSFSQRANSNLVDISYDLSDPDGDSDFTVTFDVSTDGGGTWTIKPERWSGDAGSGVKAGRGKRIAWDAFGDCGTLRASSVVVRIKADDGRMAKRAEPPRTPSTPSEGTRTGEEPAGAPSGMKYLQSNSQGYMEYLWLKDSSVMVRVPAGTFTMGSTEYDSDEKPVHQVHLDGYYVDKHEVTNRQYKRFCDATGRGYPSDPGWSGMGNYFTAYPSYPVVNVSWDDAKAYCNWAGKRLPTEAEWEKAARGTDARKYPWGNGEPNSGGYKANYDPGSYSEDGYARTSPVGSFPSGASPYGCMDMAGNVWEWCNDWYGDKYYSSSASNNPSGPSSGSSRVLRGGSWDCRAGLLRCAFRLWVEPSGRSNGLGFRCVRSE